MIASSGESVKIGKGRGGACAHYVIMNRVLLVLLHLIDLSVELGGKGIG